jgi:hypothetical protein
MGSATAADGDDDLRPFEPATASAQRRPRKGMYAMHKMKSCAAAAAVAIIGSQWVAADANAIDPIFRNVWVEVSDFAHISRESQSYAERYEKLGLRYAGDDEGEEEDDWRFFVSYNPTFVWTGNPKGDYDAHPLTFGAGIEIHPGFGQETYVGYTGQVAYENTEDLINGDRFNYIGGFYWRTDLDDRFAVDAQFGGDVGTFDFNSGTVEGHTGGIYLQVGGEYAIAYGNNKGATLDLGFRYAWTSVDPDDQPSVDISNYDFMIGATYFQGGLFGGKSIGRLMVGYEYGSADLSGIDDMHILNLGGYLDFEGPLNIEIGLDYGFAMNDIDEQRLRLNFQYRF